MQVINECLKRASDENTMYELLSEALDTAANLQGNEHKLLTTNNMLALRNQGHLGWVSFSKAKFMTETWSEVTAPGRLCSNYFTFIYENVKHLTVKINIL